MKKGKHINDWNQMLAFSPVFASSKPAPEVFWPGCSAMKLEPELIRRAVKAMAEEIPGLGFSSWCCGKPTFAIGSEGQKQKRERQLGEYFASVGIKKIYTLCPNCRKTLGERTDIEVFSAWPILARYAQKHDGEAAQFPLRYILHDPCASRNDTPSQQAAREILKHRGVDFAEFDHTGPDTRCCGRINMLFLTDPESSSAMLTSRLQAAQGLPIVTYCESCAETFRSNSHLTIHLLEILFDQPVSRGILNRLSNVHIKSGNVPGRNAHD